MLERISRAHFILADFIIGSNQTIDTKELRGIERALKINFTLFVFRNYYSPVQNQYCCFHEGLSNIISLWTNLLELLSQTNFVLFFIW